MPQAEPIKCRLCGCTDRAESNTPDRTFSNGRPCYWVRPDLCSACANTPRRVEFTIPQFRALGVALRMAGCADSHRPMLDYWAAQALYEGAVALPFRTTREFLMREAILKKLEWAKPEAQAKTLAEVL